MSEFFHDSSLAFVGIQAALCAGDILRRGFGTNFEISSKTSSLNLVTEFDKASERAIIELIARHFADHAFLAEESGFSKNKGSKICWVIDPLDGTMNFVHHIPLFTVSIAALIDDQVEVGITYQPMSNELFVAQRGRGAYLNGNKMSVSRVNELELAVASTGFPYDDIDQRESAIEQFNRLLNIGNPIRIVGSATLSLAYVAAGRFDAFWGANLHPWDVAAGKLLIEEAGGKISHYDGSEHAIVDQPSVLATNGLLHNGMLAYF